MKFRLRPSTVLGCLIAALLGACSLWQLSEQDIYWQIRAGDDLWRTLSFPHVDTWSFSAKGDPWLNIQWLSTLLLRWVYGLHGEAALVAARGLLIACLFAVVGSSIGASMRGDDEPVPEWLRCVAVAALLPLAYLALSARLQLRSDLFVFMVFAALVRLWVGAWALPTKRWITLLAVVLAANLHAGTAPFVVALAITYLLATRGSARQGIAWAAAAVACFFVTPYHVTVLPLLWAHVDYAHHNILPNPDHLPMTLAYLRGNEGLWVGLGWLSLSGACLAAALHAQTRPMLLPAAYRDFFASAALWLLLTALCFNRVRSVPYHVLFMLPWVAASLPLLNASRSACAAVCTCIAAVCGFYINTMRPFWGLGVSEAMFPTGSVRFIAATKPSANLLHTFAYGAYTVWNLRDYPTYVDTRETMYWKLQPEILAAYHSPEITQGLAQKYGINTMLMPIPKTRYVSGVGFEDVLSNYLPASDWALVYFDRLSVVVVRRIPEHRGLIDAHAYAMLRPNLPANLYPLSRARTPKDDAQFVAELSRCLRDEPTQAYCLIARAAWWRATGATEHAQDAVRDLELAQKTVGFDSTQFMTLMVEMQSAYRRADMPAAAQRIADSLGPGTVVE